MGVDEGLESKSGEQTEEEIEKVGAELRGMMGWINNKLD